MSASDSLKIPGVTYTFPNAALFTDPTAPAAATASTASNASTAGFSVGNLLGGFVDLFGARVAQNLADKATGVKTTPAPSTANVAPTPAATAVAQGLPAWATPQNALIAVGAVGALVILVTVFRRS